MRSKNTKNMVFLQYPRLTSGPWKGVIVLVSVLSLGAIQVVGETESSQNTTTGSTTGKTTNFEANDSDIRAWKISSYVTLVICVVGIISNSLLLLVTYCNPLKILRKSSWITIANLSLADLLTSIFTITNCSPAHDLIIKTEYGARWVVAFLHIAYSSSFFLLLLFTIEKYIAVKYPMKSGTMITKRKVWAGCIACWAAAIVCGGIFVFETPNALIFVTAYYGILEFTVLVMILFQVLLIRNIKAADQRMVGSTNRDTHLKKISITIVILILILMVTAFPYFIAKQIEFLSYSYPHIFSIEQFPYYYFPIASLNFVVNPFIYAWRLPDYRTALAALFTRTLPHGTKTAVRSSLVLQKQAVLETPC